MDQKFLFIPIVIVILAIFGQIFLRKKAEIHTENAQANMKKYALKEMPVLGGTYFEVVQLLEDTINAQHFWVIAYNKGGMWFIPSSINILTGVYSRYEDLTSTFNVKKQIGLCLFAGDRSENIDYIPFSAIRDVFVDENKCKIVIAINDIVKTFKYATNGYGEEQLAAMHNFLDFLKSISHE